MANGIRIDQLGDAIASAVREYTEDVSAAIARKTDEVAQTMLVEIAQAAPFRNGNYARALIISSKDEYGKTRRIIWNKKYYNLVHLLEFGHALRGGGRARAFPHFFPAYMRHKQELPDHIRRIIERGGDV